MDKKSDGESDEEERKASVSQSILCNKVKSAGLGPTCDLRRDAAAVRVGAGLETSHKGVNAKGMILVMVNSEQGIVGIVTDRRRGRGGCWRLVMEDN